VNLNLLFKILSYSNLGNILSFIYLILLTNYLNKNDFSLVTSLIGLATGIAFAFNFIIPIISNEISKKNNLNLKKIYYDIIYKSFFLCVLLLIFFLFISNYLFTYYKFYDFKIIIFICGIIFFNILVYVQFSFLTGLKFFTNLNKYFTIQHGIRLILLYLLFLLSYNIYNPLLSISISLAVLVLIAHIKLLDKFNSIQMKDESNIFNIKNILRSLIISIIGAVLIYSDLVISRKNFNYDISADFNIISSLSKINYYFLSSLIFTIIPVLNENNTKKNKIFFKNILYIFLFYLVTSNLFYYFFSEKLLFYLFNLDIFNLKLSMMKINTSSILFTGSLIFLNYFYMKKKINFLIIILFLQIYFIKTLLSIKNFEDYINFIYLYNILLFFLIAIFVFSGNLKKKLFNSR
jgi:hypothetical protein